MIDQGLLNDRYYYFWKGAFSHFDLNPSAAEKAYYLSRKDNVIYLFFGGLMHSTEIVFPKDKSPIQFYVSIEGSSNLIDRVNISLEDKIKRMPKNDFDIYREIFHKPRIFSRPIVYPSDMSNALSETIEVPSIVLTSAVKKIPFSKKGGLSDNLFIYFKRFVVGPSHDSISSK